MNTVSKFLFAIIGIVASSLVGAWVFQNMWEWFIVYAFGLKPLTIIESLGVAFFWSYLTTKIDSKEEEQSSIFFEKMAKSLILKILAQIALLGIAWIVTLFQ